MKTSFILFFLLSVVVCNAQATTEEKIISPSSTQAITKLDSSTEAITKKASKNQKNLRIIFDDSNSQLIAVDSSGKIVENAIVAFQLFVKIKGVEYSEQALGSSLSKAMLQLLELVEQNTILYFENINVKNAAGNLVLANDFQYTLSYLPKSQK